MKTPLNQRIEMTLVTQIRAIDDQLLEDMSTRQFSQLLAEQDDLMAQLEEVQKRTANHAWQV